MQERLQTTIPSSNKWHNKDIEIKAEKYGMSKKDFILNALDMMMSLDETFFRKIQNYSSGLHIPSWLVMQNMIIKRMADEAAEAVVFGNHQKFLDEFMMMGEGIERRTSTGEELFDILNKQYIIQYEKKYIKMILKQEALGIPISDKEQVLLIKYRVGKTWIDSDEYKNKAEQDKRIDKYLKENRIPLEAEEKLNGYEIKSLDNKLDE